MKGNLKVTKRMLAARAYAWARTSKSFHKAQTSFTQTLLEPRRGVVSLNPERNLKPNPDGEIEARSHSRDEHQNETKMRPKEQEGGGTGVAESLGSSLNICPLRPQPQIAELRECSVHCNPTRGTQSHPLKFMPAPMLIIIPTPVLSINRIRSDVSFQRRVRREKAQGFEFVCTRP